MPTPQQEHCETRGSPLSAAGLPEKKSLLRLLASLRFGLRLRFGPRLGLRWRNLTRGILALARTVAPSRKKQLVGVLFCQQADTPASG
jgi:hypothetical protein